MEYYIYGLEGFEDGGCTDHRHLLGLVITILVPQTPIVSSKTLGGAGAGGRGVDKPEPVKLRI